MTPATAPLQSAAPVQPPHHTLVRESLKLISPRAERVASVFYEQLLARYPDLRKMFVRTDFARQGQALMWMIVWAVERLDKPDELIPRLHELGRRHDGYGVRAEHYDLVGECLLWALEAELGTTFDETLRQAWAEVYVLMATTMQQGDRVQDAA